MSTSSLSLAPMPSQRPAPSPRSRSSSRTHTSLLASRSFTDLEDLHRFPLESLHSFSFAQQSEEFLHSRQNILKRSIDFMRDRMGWAASNAAITNAQAYASGDMEVQSMMDLLARANMLEPQEHHTQGRGPITGPAEINGDNIFEKAFSESNSSLASTRDRAQDSISSESHPFDNSQLLIPVPSDRISNQRMDLVSAPTSRRVSLKRTYTDLCSVSARRKLMETLAQPYTSSVEPFASLNSSTAGLGFQIPALHAHSSKWTPASQAVFRTEAQEPWTILAANDLSCLIFGVLQSEVRHLSILEVVQKEHREWLKAKLRDPSTDAAARMPLQPERANISAVNPKYRGLGNGVTAQLLSKPSSREKSRRAQTDDGYGSSTRNTRNNNHPANKSRGVLLCGDVVPIQKRNGSRGSASVWVMEKRGGLIWVVEEITENIASIQCDDAWNVVGSKGEVEKIWGPSVVHKGQSITDLLPCLPSESLETSLEKGLAKILGLKHFAARTAAGVCIPVTVSKGEGDRTLQVSSFPHVAGMMVLSSSSLSVISSNSVFSSVLFGQERPEGLHITELVPDFDEILDVLTEEDNVPLVDGIVIPEHSFRRARTLSILRDGKANAASVFTEPSGLLAKHRDGSTIVVDIQLRVVKSGTFFSKEKTEKSSDRRSDSDDSDDTIAVTELVYALWITYSRQLHAAGPAAGLSPSSVPSSKPASPTHDPDSDRPSDAGADTQTAENRKTSVDTKTPASTLSQQLSEAASESLTVSPAQTVPQVSAANAKNEPPAKQTINDYVILEEMGQGAYGQVKLARLKKQPSKKMVLKFVTKKRILVDTWTRDRRLGTVPLEIHVLDFLRRDGLKHPNIVEMEGFFEDDINYYIEMTPHGLPGMDLFDYIELKTNMDESECRNIFKQVASAVNHLHTKALVVHRDIKDENVVLDGEGRIKLIDFGSAAYIKNGPFDVFVGTIDYAAPEVLQGRSYRGKEQDIWALGILLYTIVYKENPFYNVDEILDHPLRIPFLPFSEDCVDLIRTMLDRDVDNRLTITEVLEHPWMVGA
ncbi:Serine/threonine protein kinase, putative [Penicillium digitatum PHI26]|uniref:non-specific serine/threonine protein kinase n=2 Tax=Penicillium digitatum TaxID=36651 RepID=K9G473_PEND2|nr:Serine/threonine protein kinase, putative [Penicillium digitatum Pd1]EKV08047.1 Serine/threonine protein kinase, putative [Penicillium digitatum Pd1]EKV09643.1 Serine/threonine protein kinase, putative [Penicillium digitatum PHI26]